MGNHNSGRNAGRPLLTDTQILEIRALDIFHGMKKRKISESLGIDLGAVSRVVDGFTKGALIPSRKNLPEGFV